MIKRRKTRGLTILIVLLLVVVANVAVVSLALFYRSYSSYGNQLLVFGSVDVNPTISKAGANDYKNYIPLETADLIAKAL